MCTQASWRNNWGLFGVTCLSNFKMPAVFLKINTVTEEKQLEMCVPADYMCSDLFVSSTLNWRSYDTCHVTFTRLYMSWLSCQEVDSKDGGVRAGWEGCRVGEKVDAYCVRSAPEHEHSDTTAQKQEETWMFNMSVGSGDWVESRYRLQVYRLKWPPFIFIQFKGNPVMAVGSSSGTHQTEAANR